ncbi:MAG: Crp/Fnr family transcriptional regulator [Gorillibacterium sp.]|nr:Crp/Fnr family transcriptional regulator [Gorillibacterium sp.]
MKPTHEVLQGCLFFSGKSMVEIAALIERLAYSVKGYRKNELIVSEGDSAGHVGIILGGRVEVQKNHPSGHNVTIAQIAEGQTFGEAVLFSKENVFPATVIAIDSSSVMFISKHEMLRLFTSDSDILARYMENISDRLLMLNRKIEILSLGTLRRRIVYDLLKLASKQHSNTITLPFNKRAWAEHLNTARPSLSREIGCLRDEGFITFSGNEFTLLSREALENVLR